MRKNQPAVYRAAQAGEPASQDAGHDWMPRLSVHFRLVAGCQTADTSVERRVQLAGQREPGRQAVWPAWPGNMQQITFGILAAGQAYQ